MNNFFCNHKTQKSDPEHTFSEIDINYRRDYSKGKSFKVSIWNEVDTYNNDDFIQDFVIYDQILWVRADSTPSTNEPPTEGPWIKVMEGVSDVQFKEEGNKIFWKYEDESEWKDLFELDVVSESEIKNMLKDIATDVDSNFYDTTLSETSVNAVQNQVITKALNKKQDVISDLSEIRNKANSALQSVPSEYITEDELANKGYLTEHQDISGKQDKIADLAQIRVNAQKGATALQTVPAEYATKTDVSKEVAKIVNSAPEAFNTLKEIADWIEEDAEPAIVLANKVEQKVDKSELVIKKSVGTSSAIQEVEVESFVDETPDSFTNGQEIPTEASGNHSVVLNGKSNASAKRAFAHGNRTIAQGENSHTEGHCTQVLNVSEVLNGYAAHAEGYGTLAYGTYSHVEGNRCKTYGANSHAEGYLSVSMKEVAHAEGYGTSAEAPASHTEGNNTRTSKAYSHAEGRRTETIGEASHTEGNETITEGDYAHAEGWMTRAKGAYSHSEGQYTFTYADAAHSEGNNTHAQAPFSHAEGIGTKTNPNIAGQHVEGYFNAESDGVKVIGCGTSDEDRKNAVEVKQDGRVFVKGLGNYDGTNSNEASDLKNAIDNKANSGDVYNKTELDNRLKADFVQKSQFATINGKSITEGGDIVIEGGSSATPDWSASEGEEGFIKNRTHYAKYNNEYTQWLSPEEEDNVSFISKQPIEQIFHINDVVYVSCPNFGQVKVDKDDVTLFAIDWEGTLTTDIFGILKVHKDAESKTFTIFSNYEDNLEVSTSIYKTLDEKFIPDTIARKSELTELSDALAEASSEIEALSIEVESQNEMIEDLQNTKIDKEADDYYPQLSVGLADNLAGEDVVDSEISFRRSGGGAISDGVARIEAIKGNSVVWNQKVRSAIDSNGELGWWRRSSMDAIELSGNKVIIKPNQVSSGNSQQITQNVNFIANHKYLVIVDYAVPDDTICKSLEIHQQGDLVGNIAKRIASIQNPIKGHSESFHTAVADMPYLSIYFYEPTTFVSAEIEAKVIDLTLMFGSGNEPTTIEEFNARKPLGIDEYTYNEGEVIHMNAQSLESVGVNQWDEEWESGTIAGSDGKLVNDATKIRTSNLIRVFPNKEYHFTQPSQLPIRVFWYGADKAYKAYEYFAESTSVLIPSDVYYIKVVFEYATYNHDICINLSDASINGKYYPYIKRTQSLAIIGEGLKSAGTAHDEIRYNKATQKWEKVQRIGSVDLGSLTWVYYDNSGYLRGWTNGIPRAKGGNTTLAVIANSICHKYPCIDRNKLIYSGVDNSHALENDNEFSESLVMYVRDSSYTNAASFKAAMEGVVLYYELAEPIVTEIEGDFNLDYEVWNDGTEKILSDVPTTPLKADIAYGFNAVGKIKELEEKINSGSGGVSKDYVDGKLTELSDAIALRNVGAEDTNESVDEPEIGGGGASTDKQGVIRQTQTWTQAADKGYDYVMSNLIRGAIPQANIDLFTSAGAVFNEESGYFELNGLTDISYEEMSAIYNAGFKMVEGYWNNNIRTNIFKSCNVYNADAAQLYGITGMYANRNCKAESFKFTEQEIYGVAIKGNIYGTYEGCIYLKTFGKGVFFCQDTNISDQAFNNCYSLETIYIRNLKKNISFKYSARLSNASILYMIKQSTATSPIVITLHADAKARAEADAEIVAALSEKTNVTLGV